MKILDLSALPEEQNSLKKQLILKKNVQPIHHNKKHKKHKGGRY